MEKIDDFDMPNSNGYNFAKNEAFGMRFGMRRVLVLYFQKTRGKKFWLIIKPVVGVCFTAF